MITLMNYTDLNSFFTYRVSSQTDIMNHDQIDIMTFEFSLFDKEFIKNDRILSPNKFCHGIKENQGFIRYKEDQFILPILCHKYNITPHKDSSQYGKRHSRIGRILRLKS